MLLAAQRPQENVIPLKNWATPLYWHSSQAEKEPAGNPVPLLQFSGNAVSTDALSFVAITPCRLVDTRGVAASFNGAIVPFSGPSIPAATTVMFPVRSIAESDANTTPAPCGVIPSNAQAYSLNLGVIPQSAATVGFVTLWPAGATQPVIATVGSPQGLIASNAAIVPAGTPLGGISLYNSGPATIDVIIDMNGYFAAPSDLNGNTAIGFGTLASNTSGSLNTASGQDALQFNTSGASNTASGSSAMASNTTGSFNTASGANALLSNTSGIENTASGAGALQANTIGAGNTASGVNALHSNTGGMNNTASGIDALSANTSGANNTASGANALQSNTVGIQNTASGVSALQSNIGGMYNTASGFFALSANTAGNANTATGLQALQNNTIGDNNTASGINSLEMNVSGVTNTATGSGALQSNTIGNENTATGYQALQANVGGIENTADGKSALASNVAGTNNTASGQAALLLNTTGISNSALGFNALGQNVGGNSNIGIGRDAGTLAPAGNNNSVYIASTGSGSDANGTVRIGTGSSQVQVFVAGVSGVTTGVNNAVAVVIDSNGQLGTVSSSQRFKEDIQDMGDASSGLLRLRPVTFRYKQAYTDGSKPLDYGLIAEEVAQVYPGLAVKDKDGQIQTVQYQKLTPMLLNELQKQADQIRVLEERLATLEAARFAAAEPVR
jgi:hypothetical protein